MPVFYEPRGYTPYDKLQNWATRSPLDEDFADSVGQRVAALKSQWEGALGFQGYLVGHEDYRSEYYQALAEVVAALGKVDSLRPALTVGRLDHYSDSHAFAEQLWRIGIGREWLELRLGWNYFSERSGVPGQRDTVDGGDDLQLGFKIALTEQVGWLPAMALIPQTFLSLPN